jgi:tetraacyldisaccharide 4'-kinase
MAQETRAAVYVGPLGYHAGRLAEKEAAEAHTAEMAAALAAVEAEQLEQLQSENPPPPTPVVAATATSVAVAEPPAEAAPAEPEEDVLFGIHLLHDGFQQRQLARHVDILLINRREWEDRLMPAGTLREPHSALFRANAIAIPASEPEMEGALRAYDWQGPIWRFHRILDVPVMKEPVAAFCAIAHSDQFFESLQMFGFTLVSQHAFPNHFVYTRLFVKELLTEAMHQGARAIVTTSKDIARLGALASLFPPTMPLINARLRIEIQNIDAVVEWLAGRLA